MNQKQKEYAQGRVNRIKDTKIDAAKQVFTTAGKTLEKPEKYELIADGSVVVKSWTTVDSNYNPKLYDSFDFSEYEKDAVVDQAKLTKRVATIEDAAKHAVDEIMLGDSQEALELIKALELI